MVAVADERSNSLIVAAADDAIPTIEKLVKEIDVPVDDITELRVFPLVNSNPQEMADLLAELFPDETTQGSNQQVQFRGGGRGGFGGFGGINRGGQNQQSERTKKKGKVIAVAEPRTSSIIVSAASELMPQIDAMIRQIDSSKRGKQKVYVYSLENADAQQVTQVLQEMFDRSNTGANNNQNQSMLQSRTQQAIQQQGQNQIANQGFGGGQANQGGFNR